VNSGTKESGYGYWFPSPDNDGAAGGGFMPEPMGRAWIGKQMTRGAWYYSAEEDVGYCAAIRTHATIVTRDPVLGEIAYGALLTREGNAVKVIPRDGLRTYDYDRASLFAAVPHGTGSRRLGERAADRRERRSVADPVHAGEPHRRRALTTGLTIAGLPAGNYDLSVDGKASRR
jgi:hypothetical protein